MDAIQAHRSRRQPTLRCTWARGLSAALCAALLLGALGCRPLAEAPARPAAAPPAATSPSAGTGSAATSVATSAPPAPVAHLRVPYSAIAGSTLVLPLARDAGLFAQHGLDVEVVSIPGSTVVVQSMLAGEIPISAVSSAAVVEADLAGADIPIIAGIVNRVVNVLYTVPAVQTAADLRGHRIGVPRLGDSSDFLTRYALRQQGLDPERDVSILQVGNNAEIVTAMQNGVIDGGIIGSPITIQARHLGYHQILDLGAQGIPYQHTTVNVVGSFLRSDEDVVRRFLQAYVEAIYYFRANKAFTQKVLAEFARNDDPELLDETWDLYANHYLERVPYPTLEGIQTVLNESLQPGAKDAKPEQFVDLKLMHELEASGFFDSLRAKYGE
jgi:ABC-type nitrate/sulfonate/bicarbonate transport system substrate-binding protein